MESYFKKYFPNFDLENFFVLHQRDDFYNKTSELRVLIFFLIKKQLNIFYLKTMD